MSRPEIEEELLASFRDEASDALDRLLRLRDGWQGVGDDEAATRVLEAFRIFHNLKGAARLVGLESVEPLAHAAEELLRRYQAERERPPDVALERLARAIMAMLRYAEGSAAIGELRALEENLLAAAAERPGPESTPREAAPRARAALEPDAEADRAVAAPAQAAAEPEPDLQAGRAAETVRVRATHLDRLMAVTSELLTHHTRLTARQARLEHLADSMRDAQRVLRGEARQFLDTAISELDGLVADDRGDAQRLGHLAFELGDTVRTVRMLPLAGLVPGFRRVVEDAAAELEKRVRFEADVSEVALDRRVLEGLRDPMLHLLRNAIDHGLESPEERTTKKKPRAGSISVRARALGPMVEITVSDDGRGIDAGAVAARAVERGVVSPERARDLTPDEARELIFLPGLSTAASVTRLSGRGIGLDVVRSRLRELGGSVSVEAAPEGGTLFRLSVPVDLVSTKGLLVRVGQTIVAMPMAYVERTQRIPLEEVQAADGGAIVAQATGEPIRLFWLAGAMGEAREEDRGALMVIVVEHGRTNVGLVVAEVIGEAEFVVRPLPWNLGRVPGIAGAAVLGDGRLALVLHVGAVVAESGKDPRAAEHTTKATETRGARAVLVVDDSVTSRILVRNILDSAGYETLVATDGEEAWEILMRRPVDLVVTDVQMPRLDGHGLTRRIRQHPETQAIPVVMVTSLARPEDVALGSECGADEYIVKGRFDHRTLLEAVSRLT